jgi:signal transduction histidine kinase
VPHLSPRRRIVLLLAVAVLIGYYYGSWVWLAAKNLARYSRYGMILCSDTWRDIGTPGCAVAGMGSYNPVFAGVEVVVVSALLVLLGWLGARWALRPLRAVAETVERLGPTSLGLRLAASGPRDETRRLSDAVDAMLGRVAEGYEAQRRFAANASHELRTPLATQRALIEISLGDGALGAEQLQLLTRQLLATNERNEKLVEGLLVLAETERGLMSSTVQRLDLIVEEAAELLRPAADKAGVELAVSLEQASVTGEAPLLERLVVNVIGNAIKYNDPGGWVRVAVAPPGYLRVSNSGPPVAAERVADLFEPFRRGTGDRLDHQGGVGLGLTIVRSIVTAHCGEVRAHAEPGGGLTVEVRLP